MKRYFLKRTRGWGDLMVCTVEIDGHLKYYQWVNTSAKALALRHPSNEGWMSLVPADENYLLNSNTYLEIPESGLSILELPTVRNSLHGFDFLDLSEVRAVCLRLPPSPKTNHKIGVPKGTLP